jgi:hypothetical protein
MVSDLVRSQGACGGLAVLAFSRSHVTDAHYLMSVNGSIFECNDGVHRDVYVKQT